MDHRLELSAFEPLPQFRRRNEIGNLPASEIAPFIVAAEDIANGHIGAPSVMIGVISGAAVWLGFVITTIVVNNAFQKRTLALTVIDGGHWLAVLVLQGVVLGLFG